MSYFNLSVSRYPALGLACSPFVVGGLLALNDGVASTGCAGTRFQQVRGEVVAIGFSVDVVIIAEILPILGKCI
jgi:hypothetical protein